MAVFKSSLWTAISFIFTQSLDLSIESVVMKYGVHRLDGETIKAGLKVPDCMEPDNNTMFFLKMADLMCLEHLVLTAISATG